MQHSFRPNLGSTRHFENVPPTIPRWPAIPDYCTLDNEQCMVNCVQHPWAWQNPKKWMAWSVKHLEAFCVVKLKSLTQIWFIFRYHQPRATVLTLPTKSHYRQFRDEQSIWIAYESQNVPDIWKKTFPFICWRRNPLNPHMSIAEWAIDWSIYDLI